MTKINLFTSELTVDSNPTLEKEIMDTILSKVNSFERLFDHWKYEELRKDHFNPLQYTEFIGKNRVQTWCLEYSAKMNYDWMDCTCCAKGLFIWEVLKDVLIDRRPEFRNSIFTVNFGGDLVSTDTSSLLNIGGTPILIKPSQTPYFAFTSGNTKKRGDHILLSKELMKYKRFDTMTIMGTFSSSDPLNYSLLPFLDALTTNLYSKQSVTEVLSFPESYRKLVKCMAVIENSGSNITEPGKFFIVPFIDIPMADLKEGKWYI